MNNASSRNNSEIEIDELRVKIPLFDINIKNPLKYSIRELVVSAPINIPSKIDLTPLITVDIKLLNYDVDQSIYIISPELLKPGANSFDDVLTTTPFIDERVLNISQNVTNELNKKIKELKIRDIKFNLLKLESALYTAFVKTIPEEIRSKYSIKLRIRRRVSPEIRELIESSLTKEYKLTRMVKRMEIVRDDEVYAELEELINNFTKKLKRL